MKVVVSELVAGSCEQDVIISVMPELGGQGVPPPPQYLADQLTLFNQGGQIIPTYYSWHPQSFSPSGMIVFGTSTKVKIDFFHEKSSTKKM